MLGDLAAFPVAWFAAVTTAMVLNRATLDDFYPFASPGGTVYSVMSILVVLALAFNGQYSRRAAFWEEVGVIWRHVAMAALLQFALNFFVQVSYTRVIMLLAWFFVLVTVPAGRLITRELLMRMGWWRRKALVVGDGEGARQACAAMRHERHMGIEVVGVVTTSGHVSWAAECGPGFDVHSATEGIDNIAIKLGCEVIMVALDRDGAPQAERITRALRAKAFEIFVIPPMHGLPVQGMQALHFFSNDVLFLRLQYRLLSPGARLVKRSIDVVASAMLLAAFSPLMALVAWRIWREDGGPVFYTQPRVGKDGEDFAFIKFRSMVKHADAALNAWRTDKPELFQRYEESNFKLADDPRVLKVGQWIRRRSIDELPQLWNVLRGDMSLVGPRPLLRRELSRYNPAAMTLYEQVLPGITGLWQVSGRSDTTFLQRANLDTWYVRNWSLWVDWVILLKTFRVVLSARGAM
ncbi:MAG: undecaprenyl-phosphate galactose phosphotransferase WbaP [Massilia sp.]|nr:undecaprenyl-phosphate galactose phosphotransferase WbaP [Aquabacterium sp.]